MRKITTTTKLTGVIGANVAKSKSPDMMNAAFERLGLDYYFIPVNVAEPDFADVLGGIAKMNFAGLSVTLPYKIEVLKYLDDIDPLAEVIGAVNAVSIRDGKIKGFNTDGEGFVTGLEVDKNLVVSDHTFVIVGAGGVARAITAVLASRQARHIYVTNRTFAKAQELADSVNTGIFPCCSAVPFDDSLRQVIAASSVLINATNVGMSPADDQCPICPSFLNKDLTLVADVIYSPLQTRFLEAAQQLGCDIMNGQSQLYHQGKIAFKIWTGVEAPAEVMAAAIYDNV